MLSLDETFANVMPVQLNADSGFIVLLPVPSVYLIGFTINKLLQKGLTK